MRLIDTDAIKWRPMVHTIGLSIPDGQAYFVRKADIDAMPTIEAEPIRHGKWEETEETYGEGLLPSTFYVCSECGTEYDAVFMAACCADFSRDIDRFIYCPNCGAKMDEDVEEEKNNENCS